MKSSVQHSFNFGQVTVVETKWQDEYLKRKDWTQLNKRYWQKTEELEIGMFYEESITVIKRKVAVELKRMLQKMLEFK